MPRGLLSIAALVLTLLTSGQARAQIAAAETTEAAATDAYPRLLGATVRAAVWSKDEKTVVAVVSAKGSLSSVDTSVVRWDVATGRMNKQFRFPGVGVAGELFVRLMELNALRPLEAENFLISTSLRDEEKGKCRNLVLGADFGLPRPSWKLDSDSENPASCVAREITELKSPSGRLVLAAQPAGLAVLNTETGGRVAQLDDPRAFDATEDQPALTMVGDGYYPSYFRLVMQSRLPNEEPRLAIWTPDEKFVIAIMGAEKSQIGRGMSLIVWDFRTGQLVNRVPLPAWLDQPIFIDRLSLNAKSVVEVALSMTVKGDDSCKAFALTYKLTVTLDWRIKRSINTPASCAVRAPAFPPSPSGKYKLVMQPSQQFMRGFLAVEILDDAERAQQEQRQFQDQSSPFTPYTMMLPETNAMVAAALAPGGKIIAMLSELGVQDAPKVFDVASSIKSLTLFDLSTSTTRNLHLGDVDYVRLQWLDDNRIAVLGKDGKAPVLVFDAETANELLPESDGQCLMGWSDEAITTGASVKKCRDFPSVDSTPLRRLSTAPDGQAWVDYDVAAQTVSRTLVGANDPQPILYPDVVAAGSFPNSSLFWAATKYDGLHIDGANPERPDLPGVQITLFEEGKYFARDANGRAYDTNAGADAEIFRWRNSADGLRSFGPQTFMRNFFRPQLVPRMIACAAQRNCSDDDKVQAPRINIILPSVQIDRVRPGQDGRSAIVDITVRPGKGLNEMRKPATSGAYNLRLFRNGSLVAQFPKLNNTTNEQDVAAWRAANMVTLDADGARHVSLPVALPSSADGDVSSVNSFTAYAFNEDRVKSETARKDFETKAIARKRPPRAYVVAIGIDTYDETRLALQFAVRDACLLSKRLAKIPGYDVRQAILANCSESGKPVRVTAAMVAQVIGILAGQNVKASIAALKTLGVDASQLAASTPDDIVIVSFAGHGWADKKGAFYLVPAEGQWPVGPEPVRRTLVSALQIADRLRDVDAADMALIIDACHSAGSVDNGSFKPGPMGDPGLGQLAFDKGIRVLAATQAADVALESASLSQGLLTYALADEGLTDTGGKADLDSDGRIVLDEWLTYGANRVPALSVDARLGRITPGARGMSVIGGAQRDKVKEQKPALYDFTGKPSRVILRSVVQP